MRGLARDERTGGKGVFLILSIVRLVIDELTI